MWGIYIKKTDCVHSTIRREYLGLWTLQMYTKHDNKTQHGKEELKKHHMSQPLIKIDDGQMKQEIIVLQRMRHIFMRSSCLIYIKHTHSHTRGLSGCQLTVLTTESGRTTQLAQGTVAKADWHGMLFQVRGLLSPSRRWFCLHPLIYSEWISVSWTSGRVNTVTSRSAKYMIFMTKSQIPQITLLQ